MPFRNQTGPNGIGVMTGRQMGTCTDANPVYGRMQQNYRRFNRNCFFRNIETQQALSTSKEMLLNEKKRLESEIEFINQQCNQK